VLHLTTAYVVPDSENAMWVGNVVPLLIDFSSSLCQSILKA